MGTKSIPEGHARTGTRDAERGRSVADAGRAADATDPTAGSVWWAELLLGMACYVAAGTLALSHTAFGPFADVVVVYPAVVAVACLAGAACLGTVFVRSGLRGAGA